MVKILLNFKANPELKTLEGKTAMDIAKLQRNSKKIVKLLNKKLKKTHKEENASPLITKHN